MLAATLAAGLLALPASAAVPRLLMFTGKPLEKPVVLSDWHEIARFQQAILISPAAAARQMRGRPWLRISLFWGPQWNDYLGRDRPLSALRPRDANGFGRFYPAWRGRPAVVDLGFAEHGPTLASHRALAILERHGVPAGLCS